MEGGWILDSSSSREHEHKVSVELPSPVPFEKKPKISGATVGTEQENKWGTLERF